MYKGYRIISHLAGILGCIVAISLLCNEYPSSDLKFDYIGAIIGVLSILVTVLVTWNIYSAIRIEQRVEDALLRLAKNHDKFRNEIAATIDDVKTKLTLVSERIESAELAYITLFNATQAQVSALKTDNDYDFFQQYSHYQTALCAMLKCRHFPSDISYNIKALLGMMDDVLKIREGSNSVNDQLYDEDKNEFVSTMEDIIKSSNEKFSFEDRQRFMGIAARAQHIFKSNLSNDSQID